MASFVYDSSTALVLFLLVSPLFQALYAQTAPNCPLSGPVYLAPIKHFSDFSAIPEAVSAFNNSLVLGLENGTLSTANTSFHITVFSASEVIFEFNYIAPPTKDGLTSGILDRNTIFRTGSIGKLLTVYSLLVSTRLNYINDPVTSWVPELAATHYDNNVNTVKWGDISIKALASHLAGVRDFAIGDLSLVYNASEARDLGLPALQQSEILTCGTDTKLPACSRSEFFRQFKKLRPVSSVFNMPIYSNVAWQILAYAIEGMTNRTLADNFNTTLLRPLNLTGTFLEPPPITADLNAIIPGGEVESWWRLNTGDGASSAAGLTFSTGADLTAIGQSILSSSLLPQQLTRQWLKPVTHTADLRLSVGMPWEIFRTELPMANQVTADGEPRKEYTRIVDLYCKNGGIGAYNNEIALSPEHGFGFTILTAGRPPMSGPDLRAATLQLLNRMTTETFLPAFETAARELTAHSFAGTYVAPSKNDSSSMIMTLVVEDGGLGLGVHNWKEGGHDRLKSYFVALQEGSEEDVVQEPSLRLYPVGLRDDNKVAFRGVYELPRQSGVFSTVGMPPFGTYCAAWASVSEPTYGNVGLDDFVFDVDKFGRAIALTANGVRRTMLRM